MSKYLKIVKIPDPILRKKSKPVEMEAIKSKEAQNLLEKMGKTMIEEEGAGLAAPQIGKNIRLFVINMREDGIVSMFNPVITKRSWAKDWGEEACLSVPDKYGEVKRHRKINYSYIDKRGKKITGKAEGIIARVIQHELDHLDGILFIDKARNLKKI